MGERITPAQSLTACSGYIRTPPFPICHNQSPIPMPMYPFYPIPTAMAVYK